MTWVPTHETAVAKVGSFGWVINAQRPWTGLPAARTLRLDQPELPAGAQRGAARMSMQSHPLRPFLMTFAIASAIALYPYRFGSVAWVVGGLLGAIAAYALVLAVPWDRWPRLLSPCTSLLFVAVVGALMAGKGSVDMSLVALLLLPILWNALYGRPWEMAVATAGAAAAILAVAYQFGEITGGSIAAPLLVWTAVCCLITYAIRRLRND